MNYCDPIYFGIENVIQYKPQKTKEEILLDCLSANYRQVKNPQDNRFCDKHIFPQQVTGKLKKPHKNRAR